MSKDPELDCKKSRLKDYLHCYQDKQRVTNKALMFNIHDAFTELKIPPEFVPTLKEIANAISNWRGKKSWIPPHFEGPLKRATDMHEEVWDWIVSGGKHPRRFPFEEADPTTAKEEAVEEDRTKEKEEVHSAPPAVTVHIDNRSILQGSRAEANAASELHVRSRSLNEPRAASEKADTIHDLKNSPSGDNFFTGLWSKARLRHAAMSAVVLAGVVLVLFWIVPTTTRDALIVFDQGSWPYVTQTPGSESENIALVCSMGNGSARDRMIEDMMRIIGEITAPQCPREICVIEEAPVGARVSEDVPPLRKSGSDTEYINVIVLEGNCRDYVGYVSSNFVQWE